jgi:hypothetical protein
VVQEHDWICSNSQSRGLSRRQSQTGSWGPANEHEGADPALRRTRNKSVLGHEHAAPADSEQCSAVAKSACLIPSLTVEVRGLINNRGRHMLHCSTCPWKLKRVEPENNQWSVVGGRWPRKRFGQGQSLERDATHLRTESTSTKRPAAEGNGSIAPVSRYQSPEGTAQSGTALRAASRPQAALQSRAAWHTRILVAPFSSRLAPWARHRERPSASASLEPASANLRLLSLSPLVSSRLSLFRPPAPRPPEHCQSGRPGFLLLHLRPLAYSRHAPAPPFIRPPPTPRFLDCPNVSLDVSHSLVSNPNLDTPSTTVFHSPPLLDRLSAS